MRFAVATGTTRLRDAIAADEVQPTSAFEALMVAARERSSFVETNRDRAVTAWATRSRRRPR